MQHRSSHTSKRVPKIRRSARAVKSSFRRYPRAIYESLRESQSDQSIFHLPEILHTLSPHDLAIVWLGHGSVVTQLHDTTIVLDPVLSNRIGMRIKGRTIGLSRLIPSPISAESLIGSDLLLITHAHFDHLDKPTLLKMCSPATTVVTPHRCAKLIPDGFARVIELKAGEKLHIHDLDITAIEPAHWGARTLFDRKRGVNSYLIESKTQRLLFTGDTAHTKAYLGLGPIDLAVFGIGAYDPWDHMHATPEQAWSMFQELDARYMLPIHHSTFELSEEPIDEPMRRLFKAANEHADLILEPSVGEIIVIDSSTTNSKKQSARSDQSDTPPPPKP